MTGKEIKEENDTNDKEISFRMGDLVNVKSTQNF